jgi:anti-anti-sigma factor
VSFFYISEELLDDGVQVIAVGGEVDFAVSPQLKQQIVSRVHAGRRHVIIDLSEAEFIDSTAIGVIVAGHNQLRQVGGTLTVVCFHEHIRNIFEIVGLENTLSIHRSRDDAVSALARAA